MTSRDELVEQVANSSPTEVADALIEQERELSASRTEVDRLEGVIKAVHATVEPVLVDRVEPGRYH